MKKFLALFLSIVLVVSMTGMVCAAEVIQSEEIIYFEDGSYLITTTVQSAARTTNTTTGFTRKTYVDADGNTDWRAVLTGTYTYNGTTATCTESTIEVYIYDNAYRTLSKEAGKSGASATGSFTIGWSVLGIIVDQDTYSMTLTCSPTGTLS